MLPEKNGDMPTFKFEVHVLLNIIIKITGKTNTALEALRQTSTTLNNLQIKSSYRI